MPAIGVAAVLLITVKTVPGISVPLPRSAKENCAPVLMVTPLAITSVCRDIRERASVRQDSPRTMLKSGLPSRPRVSQRSQGCAPCASQSPSPAACQ